MNPPKRGKLGHSVERVSAISVLAHSHMDEGTSTHYVHSSQEGRNVGKCSQSAKIYVQKFDIYLILLSNTRVMFYKKQLIRNIVHFCQKLRNKN